MADLKLIYFDFDGGRGEPARLALSIAGIAFEDDRVSFQDWPNRKADMPFASIPVLECDGRTLTQSNAINRYVGRLTGLYPSDPWQAALCDEAMDAVEDIVMQIVPTFSMPEEEKKTRREALAAGPIPLFLSGLGKRLAANGDAYFADNRLTIADLKVFVWLRQLKSGNLDHVPTDLPDRIAPNLVAHLERMKNEPGVRAYYDKRQKRA